MLRKAVLALLLVSASVVHAELVWDKTELVFKPLLTDTSAVGDFTFTNAGKTPITIESVEPSCDCTTAELTKKTYLPGEKGKITVTFTIGDRYGLKSKVMTVKTDESKDSFIALTMTIHLPESPDIMPTYCYWHKDEDRDPKVITVKVVKDCPFTTYSSVVCSDDRIKADLKTVIKEKEYTVSVRPKSTKEPFNSYVDIYADIPAGKPKHFRVHVGVLKD